MASHYRERLQTLQRSLTDHDASTIVLSAGPNLEYVSGFRGEADRYIALVVRSDEPPTFVTPEQYRGQVLDASWIDTVRSVPSNNAPTIVEGLGVELANEPGRILLDDHMSVGVGQRLRDGLDDAAFGLAGALVGELRLRKDERELAALRRAAAVADEVSEGVRELGEGVIGMTEREVAVEIRSRLHAKGGERLSFEVVVGSGPNGARPGLRHGDREIRHGDPVVLDFGAFVDGYASDQTRTTVFAGDPPSGFVDAHDAVTAGLQAGIEAITPGMEARTIDRTVRKPIEERGFGKAFTTGTGHGVGLEAHEPPAITPESETVVKSGMVFSLEPGVYIEGEFGVRVEELVAVTDDGCERLNASPRTWKSL